jgi:3-dehydroquinate synthase
MNFSVKHALGAYTVHCERGGLARIGSLFALDRRVLIVTDTGVPAEYAKRVAEACGEPYTVTVPMGEESKSMETMKMLCEKMLSYGFTRKDCVIAVGGGVVGDLACFAASAYMRGIDFYNVPTTVLSAVDSSVGGKCGVNLSGVKNVVGAFYQPKGVLFDAEVLKSLPKRQIAAGLAEAVKMAATFDEDLFSRLEGEEITDALYEALIFRAVQLKAKIVEQDEREGGLRKSLNFGHTFGHAIEAAGNMELCLHGECVALGMLPFCSDEVYQRLYRVLKRLSLPTALPMDASLAIPYLAHDKKWGERGVDIIFCEKIGSFDIKTVSKEELISMIEKAIPRYK